MVSVKSENDIRIKRQYYQNKYRIIDICNKVKVKAFIDIKSKIWIMYIYNKKVSISVFLIANKQLMPLGHRDPEMRREWNQNLFINNTS